LNEIIKLIKKINKINGDISENQTLISTILPLFQVLDWDIFNEERVLFEDTTSTKKRVDATFVGRDRRFIIEAKRFSRRLSMKDFEQLTVYINSDESINFGLLTNGWEYWLADNKGEGLENKLIYKFNVKELTDCDLNLLKKFLSYSARFNIEDITKYIEYIAIGQSFGDKECVKIFEETPEEPTQIDLHPKKEGFDEKKSVKEVERTEEVKIENTSIENEKIENPDNSETKQAEQLSLEVEASAEEVKKKINTSSIDEIVIVPREKGEEVSEYFEVFSKTEVRIFFQEKFHIIRAKDFSTLVIKTLKYVFEKLKDTPALYQGSVDEFDFITETGDRNIQSGKYEEIGNGIFFNSNISSVAKISYLEKLLKFIHD
jgi:hypothetical protein